MSTVILLTISNIFMTIAWYGHLKFKNSPLWKVVFVSWMIAFVEYCFQVPANRFGHNQFSAAQLKTIQEVITLVVFCIFSIVYLKEDLKWNYLVGFLMTLLAVFFIPRGLKPRPFPAGRDPVTKIIIERDRARIVVAAWAFRPKGTLSFSAVGGSAFGGSRGGLHF